MTWTIEFHDAFAEEFRGWRHDVQRAAATAIATLQIVGPTLGRPHADTLKGSRHANMKELRFSVGDGEWRIAYAFERAGTGFCWSAAASPVWRPIASTGC